MELEAGRGVGGLGGAGTDQSNQLTDDFEAVSIASIVDVCVRISNCAESKFDFPASSAYSHIEECCWSPDPLANRRIDGNKRPLRDAIELIPISFVDRSPGGATDYIGLTRFRLSFDSPRIRRDCRRRRCPGTC